MASQILIQILFYRKKRIGVSESDYNQLILVAGLTLKYSPNSIYDGDTTTFVSKKAISSKQHSLPTANYGNQL